MTYVLYIGYHSPDFVKPVLRQRCGSVYTVIVTSFQRGTASQKGSNTLILNPFADKTMFKTITLAIAPVNCNH